MFLRSESWMYGPFEIERAIRPSSLGASLDDEPLRARIVARLVALRGNTPRGDRVPAAGGLALAAAVRVVDRVHGDAAHERPPALPAVAPCLADGLVLVLDVAHLSDGGAAV